MKHMPAHNSPVHADADINKLETRSAPELVTSHVGALYALAAGTFAVGTEGFMIAAILPEVAHALSVGVPAAGQLVTVFTLIYAISSPLLTAFTAVHSRRALLMGSLAAFVLANLLAAAAHSYWSLMGARILLALAAGLYVPNANALAGTLVHPSRRGRALAIVNGGITVAVALGVPAGAFVGAHLGWRLTFVGVAVLAAAALLVLTVRLPRNMQGSAPASVRERLAIIAYPGALGTLATTTLWATGAYAVYTYVSPFISVSTGLPAEHAGMMITVVGVSAIFGVTLGGIANDHWGARRAQAIALPLLAMAFAGLTVAGLMMAPAAMVPVLALMVVWGLSAWGFYPPQQDRLIAVVGVGHAPVALSLNASFMYLGFALGAALGSLVIALTSVLWIGLAGALCIIAAALISQATWAASASRTRVQHVAGGPGH